MCCNATFVTSTLVISEGENSPWVKRTLFTLLLMNSTMKFASLIHDKRVHYWLIFVWQIFNVQSNYIGDNVVHKMLQPTTKHSKLSIFGCLCTFYCFIIIPLEKQTKVAMILFLGIHDDAWLLSFRARRARRENYQTRHWRQEMLSINPSCTFLLAVFVPFDTGNPLVSQICRWYGTLPLANLASSGVMRLRWKFSGENWVK